MLLFLLLFLAYIATVRLGLSVLQVVAAEPDQTGKAFAAVSSVARAVGDLAKLAFKQRFVLVDFLGQELAKHVVRALCAGHAADPRQAVAFAVGGFNAAARAVFEHPFANVVPAVQPHPCVASFSVHTGAFASTLNGGVLGAWCRWMAWMVQKACWCWFWGRGGRGLAHCCCCCCLVGVD